MVAAARRAPTACGRQGSKQTRWQAAEEISRAYLAAQEHNDIHAAEDAIQRAAEHAARWYIEDGLPSERDRKEVPAAETQTAPAFDDATLQIMLWEAEDAGRENPELMNERSVACESCNATPGEPCREPSGRVLVTVVHRKRRQDLRRRVARIPNQAPTATVGEAVNPEWLVAECRQPTGPRK